MSESKYEKFAVRKPNYEVGLNFKGRQSPTMTYMSEKQTGAPYYIELGWIYEMQGRADEGIAEFKKALAINPNHGGVYNRLAGIYLAKGMLDEAIEAYQKVIALNPYSETAYYGLGIAYHRKDKFAEAGHALFEAGLLAIFRNNKRGALNAYKSLKETGNAQLADELQKVLGPWFDPATETVAEHK